MENPRHQDLRRYLLQSLEASDKNLYRSGESGFPKGLTAGVEHEFFLEHEDGTPASHELSQAFLKDLSTRTGWQVRSTGDSPFGEMITRVSVEHGRGRYTAVKYDHHPHLMEIAFTFYGSLHDLYAGVSAVMDQVGGAAKAVGARVSASPFASRAADDPHLISPVQDFVALREYRAKLFRMRGVEPTLAQINYASEIAATQVHIGGTKWWTRSGYVSNLYRLETEVLMVSSELSSEGVMSAAEVRRRRWQGYSDVFHGYPLVGYPQIESWSIDSWIDAMFRSPLYSSSSGDWAGQTLEKLPKSPFENWSDFIASVRDLQIIRPKTFGTLEFRADAYMGTPEKIAAIAALRLGLSASLLIAEERFESGISQSGVKSWWRAARGESPLGLVADVVKIAERGLRLRNRNEERLLAPFHSLKAKLRKAV